MGTRRLMSTTLTYKKLCVRDTKDVIELCRTWWYQTKFFENTDMQFETQEVYWWNLFQSGVMMGTVGRNENKELKSCYVAMKQPYMFNHSFHSASEIVWCIDTEYRTGRNLIQLLNEIEACNEYEQTAFYNLNLPVLEDTERLVTKLESRAFFKQDMSMIKQTNLEKQDG